MGATKNELYPQEILEVCELFQVLSNPARLTAILAMVVTGTEKDVTVQEALSEIELSQATKSYHMKRIEKVGFVKTRVVKRNKKSCKTYRLNIEAIRTIRHIMEQIESKVIHVLNNRQTTEKERFASTFRKINLQIGAIQT